MADRPVSLVQRSLRVMESVGFTDAELGEAATFLCTLDLDVPIDVYTCPISLARVMVLLHMPPISLPSWRVLLSALNEQLHQWRCNQGEVVQNMTCEVCGYTYEVMSSKRCPVHFIYHRQTAGCLPCQQRRQRNSEWIILNRAFMVQELMTHPQDYQVGTWVVVSGLQVIAKNLRSYHEVASHFTKLPRFAGIIPPPPYTLKTFEKLGGRA